MTPAQQRHAAHCAFLAIINTVGTNLKHLPSYWDIHEIKALIAEVALRASGTAAHPHNRTIAKMRRDSTWASLSLNP